MFYNAYTENLQKLFQNQGSFSFLHSWGGTENDMELYFILM